jgi:aldehyde:ferredoxin oxidoreductase
MSERGGATGKPCVPGCTIRCSNIFANSKGETIVASLQYEGIVLLGSNLEIPNLDDVGELYRLCDEVGVDCMDTGVALGIAMEAGVLPFGDAEGAKDLIKQIGEGTPLGRIIGNGAQFTGIAYGSHHVAVGKGQAFPAYDPRSLKGNGVTYITSNMGADHTSGNCFETVKYQDPLSTKNQVYKSRQLQVRAAIIDSMGMCLFTRPAFVKNPQLLVNLFKAKFNIDISFAEIRKLGAKILDEEHEYNRKAGVSEEFRPMPEFMREEPLPPNNTVFDISEEEMQKIWDVPVELDTF